jgi:hypothetical protein
MTHLYFSFLVSSIVLTVGYYTSWAGAKGEGAAGPKGRRGERKRKSFSFSNFHIFLDA